MAIDDVAVDFPHLRIVLAHVGRPLYMETCLFLARRFPNVWFDVSSIPPSRLLHYVPRLAEFADKALFGTDFPYVDLEQALTSFDKVDFTSGAREKILYSNAQMLFQL